ncbi:type II toxin-antitoxin system VapB family antitoxin [Georgenia subflava]|uniref:Transcription factor n=1 Tax=Georgenia subflava TaxID=1622177 RepID=A0A6N7EK38_9MICO|nr:type II toxin-antitoxin system VapB family antitoxin [Georgenia subflava]MPV37157.1 transcription factor [Georgenia subflava]
MGLNIKNERVHELARAVARRTGASQTGAIEAALERYLADLDADARRDDATRRQAVDRTLTDMRQRLSTAGVTGLATDDLYDESGLPE